MQELSRRKKQYRAKKRNQHPPSVSFGSARRIVLALIVLVLALIALALSIRQDGENQTDGC